ncbi:type 1 glutamine amidotransferase domain-containing protein [Streptomyces sp. NBC_00868]|uniref:type 1 glutamine amidotransferase domain-containing protein n=1 Tax=Streptomyces sp. NBC_00868 TaxID=2903683 RepID=UPI00386D0224|nr:type 1 glutamine amidotransferase domain-containing protein [Streptomyces sp. NBC_00868]
MPSILIVLTGARHWTLKDGTAHPTGFWGEEFIESHRAFTAAGAQVTLATPGGVRPVVDELSLAPAMNGGDEAKVAGFRAYLAEVDGFLAAPRRLEDMNPADYDAVFVPGGHGPMQDLAVSDTLGQLLVSLLDTPGKVVASVCHGPAGFLAAGRADGSWAFAGRHLTAFTNDEETQAGFADKAPWLLEDRLRAAGAKFDAGASWGSHVIVDGNLVTGQNPGSTIDAAHRVLELLA